MRPVPFFTLLLLPVAQTLMGFEGITITLKEQAVVSTPNLLLGDIAELRGHDRARIEQLSKLQVGQAPSLGFMNLSRERIQELVGAAPGGAADVDLSGSTSVQVRLKGTMLRACDLVPLLKEHLVESTSWRESEVEVRSIGNLKDVEVPSGDVSFRVAQTTAPSGASIALLPIEIVLDGKLYRTFWVNVDLRIRAAVVQAARRIPYGKSITPEDVREAVVEIQDARTVCLRKVEDAVGKTARRSLSPGDPLTRESVASPFLVRSGDTVRLRLDRGGIQVATLARAEENGRLGQFIRIRNLDFSRPVKAQVVGRGEVRIE